MTKEQIITVIVAAVISSLTKLIFDTILAPYIPDKKKLSSYIKKFLRFTLAYIWPIAVIIWLMISFDTPTKFFVFALVINFFALAINMTTLLFTRMTEHHTNLLFLLKKTGNLLDRHADIVESHTLNESESIALYNLIAKKMKKLEEDISRLKRSKE